MVTAGAQVLSGEAFFIADHVESVTIAGLMSFPVSDTGSLSYGIGSGPATGLQMAWVNREGKVLGLVGPEGTYQGIALVPDGKRIAAHRHDAPGGDIWVTDARGSTSRFTFDASQDNSSPVWSPDGSAIAFASRRQGKFGVYRKPSNNTDTEELLFEHERPVRPVSWASDGRSIVLGVSDPTTSQDIWVLQLSGERRAVPWLHTRFRENQGQISPDGRSLAYHSQESGPYEVFVRPFPSGSGQSQVSTNGGGFPMWRADGRERFYLSRNLGSLFSVAVTSTGSTIGKETELFESRFASYNLGAGQPYSNYAISGDGQRILVARPTATEVVSAPIAVVVNWIDGVRK
jgi:eukaryotic-like serine/threonine-protein kinase